MDKRVKRRVATWQGVGVLYDNGQKVSQAQYNVEVWQEFIIVRAMGEGGPSEQPGHKETVGAIVLQSPTADLILGEHDPLLVMEDGRGLRFIARQQKHRAGGVYCSILGNGAPLSPEEVQAAISV